jgi:hypothetical protein
VIPLIFADVFRGIRKDVGRAIWYCRENLLLAPYLLGIEQNAPLPQRPGLAVRLAT